MTRARRAPAPRPAELGAHCRVLAWLVERFGTGGDGTAALGAACNETALSLADTLEARPDDPARIEVMAQVLELRAGRTASTTEHAMVRRAADAMRHILRQRHG